MENKITVKHQNKSSDIYLHPVGETVSDHIRHTKAFFEQNFLMFIEANYKKQSEILDIGANIGNHSLFFAKYLDCTKVHMFEPVQKNIELCKKNVNEFSDKCILYDIALSDKSGHMTLYNSQKENFGGFSLHSYSNGSSFLIEENIKVETLDSFNLNNISMIKMDVENHENEVLAGARQTILRNKPIIFIENLHHGYPKVCPDPEPHEIFFKSVNYKKIYYNIVGSFMDLWIPAN
jgi:protein O-GlcNAc transferase